MVRHSGGCHRGKVRFEVIAPSRLSVAECNCSMCSTSGYLHLIVPKSRFRLLQGEDFLTTYTFNTTVAKHFFCSVCGVKSFYVPSYLRAQRTIECLTSVAALAGFGAKLAFDGIPRP
jgi:hypothetical protein